MLLTGLIHQNELIFGIASIQNKYNMILIQITSYVIATISLTGVVVGIIGCIRAALGYKY